MNELSKIFLILVMVFLVIVISLSAKREVSLDWTTKVSDTSKHLATKYEDKNFDSKDDVSLNTSFNEDAQLNSENLYVPEPTSATVESDFQSVEGTESTNKSIIIPLQSATEVSGVVSTVDETDVSDLNLTEEERIYKEFKEVEMAARKYISAAYKISTLNSYNIHSKGFMNDYLSSRYDVGYKMTSDGYTIYIKPKYEISQDIANELIKQKGVRFDGQNIIYEFWIRAYR